MKDELGPVDVQFMEVVPHAVQLIRASEVHPARRKVLRFIHRNTRARHRAGEPPFACKELDEAHLLQVRVLRGQVRGGLLC